jgi:hypothetical protein
MASVAAKSALFDAFASVAQAVGSRGPYRIYADDAVRFLRKRGVNARRLGVGLPEWRRAGLPIETAT